MKPRFPQRDAEASASETGSERADRGALTLPASREDRACCCPAYPVVRAVMPPTPERSYSVDLLLCGHHYRVSRQALAAAGARVYDLPGKADAAAAALLDVHGDHPTVT